MTSILSSSRPRRTGAALAAATACALLATASAQAAGATSAVCTPRISVTISPGFSLAPSSGTLTSHGQRGTLICTGKVGGHRVTGPGTVGLDETYAGGTCLRTSARAPPASASRRPPASST